MANGYFPKKDQLPARMPRDVGRATPPRVEKVVSGYRVAGPQLTGPATPATPAVRTASALGTVARMGSGAALALTPRELGNAELPVQEFRAPEGVTPFLSKPMWSPTGQDSPVLGLGGPSRPPAEAPAETPKVGFDYTGAVPPGSMRKSALKYGQELRERLAAMKDAPPTYRTPPAKGFVGPVHPEAAGPVKLSTVTPQDSPLGFSAAEMAQLNENVARHKAGLPTRDLEFEPGSLAALDYGARPQVARPATREITGTPSEPMPRISQWRRELEMRNARVGKPTPWETSRMSPTELKERMGAYQAGIDEVAQRHAALDAMDMADRERVADVREAQLDRESAERIAQINAQPAELTPGEEIRLARLRHDIGLDRIQEQRAAAEAERGQREALRESVEVGMNTRNIPPAARSTFYQLAAQNPGADPELIADAIEREFAANPDHAKTLRQAAEDDEQRMAQQKILQDVRDRVAAEMQR